jgi:hypothetical protein
LSLSWLSDRMSGFQLKAIFSGPFYAQVEHKLEGP